MTDFGTSYGEVVKRATAIHRSFSTGIGTKAVNVVGRISRNGFLFLYVKSSSYFRDNYRLIITVDFDVARRAIAQDEAGRNGIWYGLGLAVGTLYDNADTHIITCPRCANSVGNWISTTVLYGSIIHAVCETYQCCAADVFSSPVAMSKTLVYGEADTCGFSTPVGRMSGLDRFALRKPKSGQPDPDAVRSLRHWLKVSSYAGRIMVEERNNDAK